MNHSLGEVFEAFHNKEEDCLDSLLQDDLLGFLGSGDIMATLSMEIDDMPKDFPTIASLTCEATPSSHRPLELAIQRSAGPPTSRKGPARIITTELPKCMVSFGEDLKELQQQIFNAPKSEMGSDSSLDFLLSPDFGAESGSGSDSDDSNDTADKGMLSEDASTRCNKRKAPDVDWRSISDVTERRRQRRLAKNRLTAARSRERKKSQWAEMESKLQLLQKDNSMLKAVMEMLKKENSALKQRLNGVDPSTARAPSQGGKMSNADPAVVALVIAILLLLASSLPADGATLLLMSSVPIMLLSTLFSAKNGECRADILFASLAQLQAVLSSSLLLRKTPRSPRRDFMRLPSPSIIKHELDEDSVCMMGGTSLWHGGRELRKIRATLVS